MSTKQAKIHESKVHNNSVAEPHSYDYVGWYKSRPKKKPLQLSKVEYALMVHWEKQFLHCYDYCKTALDEKTLSEDEMESKGTALNA